MLVWKGMIRPLLFCLDAERAHHATMGTFAQLCSLPGAGQIAAKSSQVDDPRLRVERFGITFENPVMLAAGFDKNARWFNALHQLGFGAIEVGTVTRHAQSGNPKPRLFRLAQDVALLNRMGFNNDGAEAIAKRLRHSRIRPRLGINLGLSKVTPLEQAAEDYLQSFQWLSPYADYITINVSSPNTPNLRKLQDRDRLNELLGELQQANRELAEQKGVSRVPILLKIAPDLTDEALLDVCDLAVEHQIAGMIATNTTISREDLLTDSERLTAMGNGGISGRPLRDRSRKMVATLYQRLGSQIPIVGVGGIMNGDDAWEMMRAGASLIQTYTGFVYGGPGFVKRCLRRLVSQLDQRNLLSIQEIVGEAAEQYSAV